MLSMSTKVSENEAGASGKHAVAQGIARPKILHGWKSIGGYLGIPARTMIKYADENGAPIKKIGNTDQAHVCADPAELDAWWKTMVTPRVPKAKP